MKDRLEEFKKKLADLIDEYQVEITASDEYQGYPECGEDIQIVFHITGQMIDGKYHGDADDKLGTYIDSERLRK